MEQIKQIELDSKGPSFHAGTFQKGIALYVHVPFCQSKCIYCDFNTYAGLNHVIPNYLESLTKDIILWGNFLDHPTVNCVFFGGGTPSLLSSKQLNEILTSIRSSFDCSATTEVTAEINPDDVTSSKIDGFLRSGVNRLSIGFQSLDQGLLQLLSRRHGVEKAVEALEIARYVGVKNINVDLMYGVPTQSLIQFQETLELVASLQPEHISAYGLTVETGTPLEKLINSAQLPDPDPDLAADMYLYLGSYLSSWYTAYEISNWALPGRECRHNMTYWKNLPYLGIGPGAHSYLGGYRFSVVDSPFEYIQKVNTWNHLTPNRIHDGEGSLFSNIPTLNMIERIELQLEMAETLTLGMRLANGIKLSEFHDRFGVNLFQPYGDLFQEVINLGLVDYVDEPGQERVKLSKEGRILGNQVFWRFFVA